MPFNGMSGLHVACHVLDDMQLWLKQFLCAGCYSQCSIWFIN
jgi:hypothetical protein